MPAMLVLIPGARTLALLVLIVFTGIARGEDPPAATLSPYANVILADKPVGYWTMEEKAGKQIQNYGTTGAALGGTLMNQVMLGQAGPRLPDYPLFNNENRALLLGKPAGWVVVSDPGEKSPLDFDNGDSITIEAWINLQSLSEGQQVYILGKGRTNNPGVASDNQNYSLRMRGMEGTARLSFLFRNADNRPGQQNDFHRWNSKEGLILDGRWHHVAFVYRFGDPDSAHAVIDGTPGRGSWEMGGPTSKPPVVDNDELWIGSSMGGNPGCSFQGGLDEVALYRHLVPIERLSRRYRAIFPDPREAEYAAAEKLPRGTVEVGLFESVPSQPGMVPLSTQPHRSYQQKSLAFVGVPRKYTTTGVIDDRSNPYLLRARSWHTLDAQEGGVYSIVLRARSAAQLFIDGELVAQTPLMSKNADGHEAVPELKTGDRQDLRLLPAGYQEELVSVELTAGEHLFRLDALIGGPGQRAEVDELCVAIAGDGEGFQLLIADDQPRQGMREKDWQAMKKEQRSALARLDAIQRREASREWREYWDRRHALGRELIARQEGIAVPTGSSSNRVYNEIDQFINSRLDEAGITPAAVTDDYEFLRRVTLDTVGVTPSLDEIRQMLSDRRKGRRDRVIDRLLDDPRWADNWVGYWQDVLAENPGILKPKLNNTGPFRWWIYESFLDNKAMDQFVTELVMMEGSTYDGGPAGFAMATQNDVPMAAKAQVLTKAFLGIEMKCARCHDAPFHPFKQEELFGLAAMLTGKKLDLPQTSVAQLGESDRESLVTVSLAPGATILPHWPFPDLSPGELPASFKEGNRGLREELAARLTAPSNRRFAEVIVNRLWQRYLGVGLVDPVDDWDSADDRSSHQELLDYLASRFIESGYDLKQVAGMILRSHTYQRIVEGDADAALFAAAQRRRMTAEQLVDSLFTISGKQITSELLTLDPQGRRPVESFLNLGRPTRAWQLTALSNERDRPALALPMAQEVVEFLRVFGWRDSRPNPLTVREETATVLQPLTLANGVVGRRTAGLSDDNDLTELALEEIPLHRLIEKVTLRILSRPPTDSERKLFAALLSEGYSDRIRTLSLPEVEHKTRSRNAVSWSNHLSAEATRIKMEIERQVRQGDPPSERLQTDWRERMEDVIWALLNSPEFTFLP
ncbi:MAG: DUF1553 domain-containing protein [Pirellulaceae bacterium]